MKYNIISSGSKGNAVVIKDCILIDCGVSYRQIKQKAENIKLVLLTHIHGDHFNSSTIRRLAMDRPLIRFGCGKWLIKPLLSLGLSPDRIDVLDIGKAYGYCIGGVNTVISPVKLYHDVENIGYRIFVGDEKFFYATDTYTLEGITAKNYDLYLVEANYEDSEIKKRIAEKLKNGEYAYEIKNMNRHLSKQQADNFIYANAGAKSEYVYLHCHEGLLF